MKVCKLVVSITLPLLFVLAGFAQPGRPQGPTVGILIFPGVQIIDYTGPYEVFGQRCRVVTVAERLDTITTFMGMKVFPSYSFADCPDLDVLVVPGGGGSRPGMPGVGKVINNPRMLDWVKEKSGKSKYTLSVCNGAFILAYAGLLDGLKATTTATLIPMLKEAAKNTEVVSDKRYVDNGKIITSAGLSAGIEGALHVMSKLFSKGIAQDIALGIEYDWNPASDFARAMLADKYVRYNYQGFDESIIWTPINKHGNRNQWENQWRAELKNTSEKDILAVMDQNIINNRTYDNSNYKWRRDPDRRAGKDQYQSYWIFTDENNKDWSGKIEVVKTGTDTYIVSLNIHSGKNASLLSSTVSNP